MGDFSGAVAFRDKEGYIKVNVKYANERLSIMGSIVEGFRDVGGGQCQEELLMRFPNSVRLVEIWERWHLNDVRAGDGLQEAFIRTLRAMGKVTHDYAASRAALKEAGILVHNGYEYGTAWKTEPVPVEILKELKEMLKITEV